MGERCEDCGELDVMDLGYVRYRDESSLTFCDVCHDIHESHCVVPVGDD